MSKSAIVKKFCKVCHDAGKPESEYTSHFVRSSTGSDSIVVCPTLLALNCRYCGKTGHTVKFCKELEQKKKAEERGVRRAANAVTKKAVPLVKMSTNAFEMLDSDEESESESAVAVVAPAPVKNAFSYASMAAKPAVPVPKPVSAPVSAPALKMPDVEEESYYDFDSYEPSPTYKVTNTWADGWLDSDDDEEYVRPVGKPAPWAIKKDSAYHAW